MENKIKNPRVHNSDGVYASEARLEDYVSLRDHFAGLAMNSIIYSNYYEKYTGNNGLPVPEFIAQQSYLIADAMLKERSETEL
jgi:hypothetical protein